MEGPIGEFYRRYPRDLSLHLNPGPELLKIPCHEHDFGHMRILYASDAPGPDGRVGWWEKASSPITDNEGSVIGWHEERNHHVRANGPDSARWIPMGWRHEFTLLSARGYHECYYLHRNPEGQIVPVYEGWTPGYR
jgi:hypothetical protein